MVSPKFSWDIWKWLKYISLEPSYFFFNVACTMMEFVNTNLYLQKACRMNATSEPNLDTPCDEHEKGLIFVTDVNTYILPVKIIVALIGIVLCSSWSDHAGRKRKIFIMLPMVGLMVESAFQCLFSYFWSVPPIYAAITSAILVMIFGTFATVEIFSCIYMADMVDTQNRTMRIGFLTATKVLSILLSKSISGYLLHSLGFFKSYSICFVLSCIAVLLAYALLEDISVSLEKKISWWSIFNVTLLTKSVKIILGKKSTKHKTTVVLLCSIFSLLLFIHIGQETVQYLYLRLRFNWNEQIYSTFLFYGGVGSIIGSLLSSVFLSRILNIHDGIIGIIATTWDAAIAISYVFAGENWHLFLISGMDIFYGASCTVCVSLISKLYDSSEMGHLFAFKQMFCFLSPLCHPIYSRLFKKTMHTMPSAIFFVSFGSYIFVVLLYGIVYKLMRKGTN